ncbi:MAG: GYD domain-containing protein [Nitrososphaerales archaeon]
MIFITLSKFKRKAKDVSEAGQKIMQNLLPHVKIIATSWRLGRYDAVWMYEGKSEKDAMKVFIHARDVASTETLVAIPREEAMKLL